MKSSLLLLLLPVGLSAQFKVGARVHVTQPVCARVDTLTTGAGCGTGNVLRFAGDKGTILRGPAGSSTGFGLSWYVHYDVPPDGWSSARYLIVDTVITPPPPPPPPVTPPSVASLTAATSLTLDRGSSTTIIAFVRDSLGNNLLNYPVTFISSAPAIATVSPTSNVTAFITAISQGLDTVYESVGGRGYYTLVTVSPPRTPVCITNPPVVGCGMFRNQSLLIGIDTVNKAYGPWFILDSMQLKRKVIHVTVSDTTP